MKPIAQPEPIFVAAGEFKAKCLKLMDEAVATQKSFTITKRGRVVGKFVPEAPVETPFVPLWGRTPKVTFSGDIMKPLFTDEELDAMGDVFPHE